MITNIANILNPLPCCNVPIKLKVMISALTYKKVQMFQHLHFYRIIPKLSTCFNSAKVLTLP